MRKYRYICIDDMPNDVRHAIARMNSTLPELTIETRAPAEFTEQVAQLARLRKDKKLDGIILDLRMDQEAQPGGRPVDYKAQRLAGELRSRMASATLRDFPIVLWSISQKFARSYNKDVTSHDFFDLVVDKDELHSALSIQLISEKLLSLSKGFDSIAKESRASISWTNLLKVPKGVVLDSRLGQSLTLGRSSGVVPTHVIARYILRKIVEIPGPLVDQSVLCARLGIDEASFPGSPLSKDLEGPSRYTGPFSDAWSRWWWLAVEKWWSKLNAQFPPILSLTAEERVQRLKICGYKRLSLAKGIAKGYDTRFTTICQNLGRPLDPMDGFVLAASELEPWQDRLYVSRKVVLKPGLHRFEDNNLDPLELDRARTERKMNKKATYGG